MPRIKISKDVIFFATLLLGVITFCILARANTCERQGPSIETQPTSANPPIRQW